MRKSVDVSGRWRARTFTFDPAKHQWGELCHKGHDRDGGHSVREQANNECVDCRWERSTAYKARQRAVKREDLRAGAELLALPLDQHITNVIGFMRPAADALGLRGSL